MRVYQLKIVTLLSLILILILSGCTDWEKKYNALNEEHDNLRAKVMAGNVPENTSKTCEMCGKPAVGWCTMRHIYVCEQHRYFTQGGQYWRCP
jgi:hypothetical protein